MSGSTFTWATNKLGADWNSASSWSPTGVPTAADTVVFSNFPSGSIYTVTVGAGDTEQVSAMLFHSTFPHSSTLNIFGSLTTNTLDYASNIAGSTFINAGGVFEITTAITDTGNQTDFFNIAGSGAGGRMELGNLSVGAQPSDFPSTFLPVVFQFQAAAGGGANTGVIEFTSGFTTGATTTQVISQVTWGDSFVFDGANFTGDTVSFDNATNTLTVTAPGGTTALTMDHILAASGTTFVAHGNVIQAVCYARGTMIRTPDGELPVEKLRGGRQVITFVEGRGIPKTVTWLGHRRVDLTHHARPETVAPIRILRGAFDENIPQRDLVVSPDHAIYVDGKLICARQLMNGTTIRQELNWTAVDYYHVQLDSHAILLAEGLPAESYIDTGNSGFFANADAPLVLHPDLTDQSDYPTREAGSCAPFVSDEASVRPVWQRLAERAAAIGKPVPPRKTTTDPGLRLLFDGRSFKPIHRDDRLVIFTLPRGARGVRVVSRAQSPTEARPWLDDRRQLGVRVGRIVLRSAEEVREAPLDHPDLAKGWWAIEREGESICRWTDGAATLPLPAMRGDVILEIHLAGQMIYALEAESGSRAERHAA